MIGELPWSQARQLCATGKVLVDGTVELDPARRVSQDQLVTIEPTAAGPRKRGLDRERLVYVDHDVVVVDKPAGTLTLPYQEGDRDTLLDLVRVALRGHPTGPQPRPLMAVHRLDKDTSGVLVIARTLAARRHLGQQLRDRTVGRRYLAIVHGVARGARHESLLVPDRGDGLRGSWGVFRRPTGAAPPTARRAVTHVRALEVLRGATLVECRLETGRQHQIRIHLSEAGHPVVGEPVYIRGYVGPRIEAGRPMLHAAELSFEHPRTGERIEFRSALPPDFDDCLSRLRGHRS